MTNYDYREVMKSDILDYIKWEYGENPFAEFSREELEEALNECLWVSDSVTGNASGSYTFNSYKAKEYVTDNIELCEESLQAFCVPAETISEKFLCEEWEYFDVTIRCYLLGEMIGIALDDLESEVL